MQMYLLAKFDDHRSYRNRDINFYIKSYMDIMEPAELTASIRHFARFLDQEYRFTIPKSWMLLVEKKQEKEHRQLESLLCFTQT